MTLLISLGVSLGLTLLLELGFALLWGLRGRALLLVALMNIMTNPAAVTIHFLLTNYAGFSYWLSVLPIEVAVVLVEGFCMRGFISRPWQFALLLNVFSYASGLLFSLL